MAETLNAKSIDEEFDGLSAEEIARELAKEDRGYYSVFLAYAQDTGAKLYIRCKTKQQHDQFMAQTAFVTGKKLLYCSDN